MIQAPRIPASTGRALPPQPAAGRFRPRTRVLKGALPVEVAPRENPPPKPSSPRVWLPTLPPALKQSWLEVHGAVAEAWSRELSSCLGNGDKVRLRGLSFATLEELQTAGASGGVINGFIAGERKAGWMIVNAPLVRALGQNGSGAGAAAEAPLTRLETIMSLRTVERLLRHMNDCYLRGGLGAVKSSGRSESLKDSPWLGPDDYLASFRYTVGDPGRNRAITVAINEALVTSIKPGPSNEAKSGPSAQLQRAAAAAPLEAAIVLGHWRVPLSELAQLAPGDEIVLPAGDDARLEVAGRRLRYLKVKWMGPARLSALVGRP